MDSQKVENLLNLALESTQRQRQQSDNLNVVFDEETGIWELIVKYHGSLDFIAEYGGSAEPLIAGYAILQVPQNQIEAVVEREEIEYVEKPKRLFYSVLESIRASCILQLTVRSPFLSGRDVLVAVIDSGLDIFDKDFQNLDDTTRVKYLWDQALNREFDEETINAALAQTKSRMGDEMDTAKLCHFIRKKTGLFLTAGGVYRGDGKSFIRMNIACPRETLNKGLELLKTGIQAYLEEQKA